MILVQQQYSTNGYYKNNIMSCQELSRQDNAYFTFSKYTSVIWVNKKEYPIIFRNTELRDNAYNKLILDLEKKVDASIINLEQFYPNKLTDDLIKKEIRAHEYKFDKHLLKCIEYILKLHEEDKISFLKKTDSFRAFSIEALEEFIQNKHKKLILNYDNIEIFSKTLRYPREFQSYISPLSFWTNLFELRRTIYPASTKTSS